MPRRRRPTKKQVRRRRLIIAALTAPVWLYLLAALAGSLIPVNRGWSEPEHGTIIYIADNGVHADIVMPVAAHGLNWRRDFPPRDFAGPTANAGWIAFGMGDRGVYLITPRWRDLTFATAARALVGGERVMHVQYVADPGFAVRQLRLRPEEYRRLWAAIRAELELDRDGRPRRIDHPGYGPTDAFYHGHGKASALRTCNSWAAGRLRLAGVETSLWPPFSQGLTWRYRKP